MAKKANFEEWKSSVVGLTSDPLIGRSGQIFRELQKGCGAEIWDFIVKHVRTKTQKKIVEGSSILFGSCPGKVKGNFKSTEGHKSEGELSVFQEKRLLEIEVLRLEKDIDELQREIAASERTAENVQSQYRCLQQKIFLLSENRRMNDVSMKKYVQFRNDANMHLSAILQRRKTSGLSRIFFAEHGTLKETFVFKEVQRILKDYAKQLMDQIAAEKTSSESTFPTVQRQDDLQVQVENLQIDFSMRDIFQSLKVHEKDAMGGLRHLAGNYEDGGNSQSDECHAVCLARKSVEQEFENARNAYIREFLRLQEKKSELKECIGKVEEELRVLDEKLQATYKNSEALQLSRSILTLEMTLCLRKEMITYLKEALQQQSCDPRNKARTLKATYQEILKLEESISRRHSTILQGIADNMETTNNIYREQQRLQHLLGNMQSMYQRKLKESLHKPAGDVCLEYNLFSSLQMQNLLTTNVGDQNVRFCKLSLNTLRGLPEMPSVYAAMQIPVFHAPEMLLPQACTLLININETGALLEGQAVQTKCFEESTSKICSKNYLETLRRSEEQCQSHIIPLVSKNITYANEGIRVCRQIQESIDVWWEQPAEKYIHEDEIEGRKYSDWLKLLLHKKNEKS